MWPLARSCTSTKRIDRCGSHLGITISLCYTLFPRQTIAYFFVCYIIKFTPSILICILMFAIIIGTSCEQTKVGRSTLGPCWMFSDVKADGDIKTDLIWLSHLLIGQ